MTENEPRQARLIRIRNIAIVNGTRPLNRRSVRQLMASVKKQGLRHAVHVKQLPDGRFEVVDGTHRVEACRNLGWKEIPAIVLTSDEAALWKWSANLHRRDLDPLSRSVALFNYFNAFNERRKNEKKKPRGGVQRNEKGYTKFAKESGYSREQIADAHRHASLAPFVRTKIYENPKLNKRSTLNLIAKLADTKKQLDYIEKKSASLKKDKPQGRSTKKYQRAHARDLNLGELGAVIRLKKALDKCKCDWWKLFAKEREVVKNEFVRRYMR
jgi:ParB-like chromosome segregation protein Spo0J